MARSATIEDFARMTFALQHTLETDVYDVAPRARTSVVASPARGLRLHVADLAPRVEELRFGDVCINPMASTVTRAGRPVALTPKELDLLLALLCQPGVVLSRGALLREVWQHRAEVMTRTVDIHIAELRRKLEDIPAKPRHLITVWKRGYRFDP